MQERHGDYPHGVVPLGLPLTHTPLTRPPLRGSHLLVALSIFGGTRSSEDHAQLPTADFLHRWEHDFPILLVVACPLRGKLFVGTHDSKILVFDLATFAKTGELLGHTGLVLALAISADELMVFSGGLDLLVKVWTVDLMLETHTVYSLVDIGDIFSLAYVDLSRTLYYGAQNATILWVNIPPTEATAPPPLQLPLLTPVSSQSDTPGPSSPCPVAVRHLLSETRRRRESDGGHGDTTRLPSHRYDRFFDSKGPGGLMSPLQTKQAVELLTTLIETARDCIRRYAHNGYVYAMRHFKRDEHVDQFPFADPVYADIVVSAGGDGVVNVWGVRPCGTLARLAQLENDDAVLCFDVCDQYLYAGLTDGAVNVWDLSTAQLISSLKFPDDGGVQAIAVHLGCVFRATKSGLIKNKLVGDRKCHWLTSDGGSFALGAFDYNGRLLVVLGGSDNAAVVWDVSMDGTGPLSGAVEESDVHDEPPQLSDDNLLQTLGEFVLYRTVLRQPEEFIHDLRKCLSFLYKLLVRMGASARLIRTQCGNPIVYGCFPRRVANEAAQELPVRILWYGHYDVVEADPANGWDTDPFEMVAQNGCVYGRGVLDNKGPVLAALYAVAQLFHEGQLPCDAVFLIEGEEEFGLRGFADAVESNRELIGDIDWVLLSNLYWLDDHTPCLNYGLRGMLKFKVEVLLSHGDRHLGVDGGVYREPTLDLVHLLGTLADKNGRVEVPGFYDQLEPITPETRAYYELVASRVQLDVTADTLIKRWALPLLTIHNFAVSGPALGTVIARAASATVLVRVVPEQDLGEVKQAIRLFLQQGHEALGSENALAVEQLDAAEPWLGDRHNAAFRILREAVANEWAVEPLFVREGGSIPTVRFLEKMFRAPAAQVPCGQSSDHAHLNNERVRVVNLMRLRLVVTQTYTRLGCTRR